MSRSEKLCRSCGGTISHPPYLEAGENSCCERCFLRRHAPEAAAQAQTAEIEAFAEALATALDLRERETGAHSKRVACHTLVLARRFARDPTLLREIYWGALLHDIGKIGVPDAILCKAGALTDAEWAVMRRHPENGHAILRGIPFMARAAEIVLCHEERYDGSGYPRGLAGEAIPLASRLFAVIDTLDAITSDRPYRAAQSYDAAKAEILRGVGGQFDPLAVDAFVAEEATLRAMVAVKCGEAPPEAHAGAGA